MMWIPAIQRRLIRWAERGSDIRQPGWHKMRSAGEHHRYNPQTIHLLQESTKTGNYQMFKQYTDMVNQEETGYIRSIMDFNYPEQGVPIDEGREC